MLNATLKVLETLNGYLWNGPLIVLLAVSHLYFTFRFFPQRKLLAALRISVTGESTPSAKNGNEKKGLSGFATLSTTLAATLGTGNIVGVSSAIALGGPGALFWCFLTGLFGIATAYAECYLSCLYRQKDADGHPVGGPMYVLAHGLKRKGIAKFYALCVIFAALGAGCTTQASAIADAAYAAWNISPHLIGMGAAVITGVIILGGVKSVGTFCSRLVPPISFLYMGACIFLLWQNRLFLLPSLRLILASAFSVKAAGGGFVGSSLLLSARFGISRGLFTNEAGIGTAAIAAGASAESSPQKQAFISMTAVFWDTIVMCTLTGFTIISGILAHPGITKGYTDSGLTSAVFTFFPLGGNGFLTIALIAFALATLVGWCYLGEKGVDYLLGSASIHSYHLVYIVMIYIGAILPMQMVWHFTDFINAIMVFPNLFCLFLLAKKIKKV